MRHETQRSPTKTQLTHELLTKSINCNPSRLSRIFDAVVSYEDSRTYEFPPKIAMSVMVLLAGVWPSRIMRYTRRSRWQTLEVVMAAVSRNGLAIVHVADQVPCVIQAAFCQNPLALGFLQSHTLELCVDAYDRDPMTFALMASHYKAIIVRRVLSSRLIAMRVLDLSTSLCYEICDSLQQNPHVFPRRTVVADDGGTWTFEPLSPEPFLLPHQLWGLAAMVRHFVMTS